MDDFPIYTSTQLLGVYREFEPVQSFWLDTFFTREVRFEEEYVEFNKLTNRRILAPFVLPTTEGKPIYAAREEVTRFKPAYIKPKDKVDAATQLVRQAGLGELGHQPAMTPAQRWDARINQIAQTHDEAIRRTWEWMAAQAILNGSVTIGENDDKYPTTVVDFRRAANHTVTKTSGTFWGESGVSIIDDITTWRERVRRAKFGTVANRLIVGTDAYAAMIEDAEVLALLNKDRRTLNQATLNLGPRGDSDIEYVGNLTDNLQVWVYNDYYEQPDGTQVPFMDSRDVLLVGPGVEGVRAFGAIADKRAGLAPLPLFPKMWDEEDPSGTFLMTQSAPIMVPVNPNATLRARVVE